MQIPTDIQYIGNSVVLIASKISKTVNIINIKAKTISKQLAFEQTFTYLGHIDHEQLIMQYFGNPSLYKFSLEEEKETELVKLPVSLIRFGGWLHNVSKMDKQVKSKLKKYWFGVSEGKVVVVTNLHKDGKKKVRVRQTDRIAQVIKPNCKALGCSLALIPYNFRRMMDELPVKPVFSKKIV